MSEECETRLRIVHINDVYVLENFPRLKTLVAEQRAAYKNCVCVLAGDFLAPSLLSSLNKGAGMMHCMNLLGFDMVCFGNHENDVDVGSLRKRVSEFKGAWLNSNMPGFDPVLPEHTTLKLVSENDDTTTREVGFLGFLIGGEGFEATYRDDSFGGASDSITAVLSCHEAASARLRTAHPEVDCVVPLTHQDLAEDRVMAATGLYPVVLGGHDHDVIREAVPVAAVKENGGGGSVVVVKAGADAVKAALVDLSWAAGTPRGAAPTVDVELVDVANYAEDPETAAAVELKLAPLRALDAATLLNLDRATMERFGGAATATRNDESTLVMSSKGTRFGPSTFATFLATLGAECARTDFSAINAGAVRGDRDYSLVEDGGSGKVTFADLQRECPFPSNVVVATCSGAVLAAAVRESRAGWYQENGPVECSNALHCDEDAKVTVASDGKSCDLVGIGGAPLDPDKLYSALLDTYDVKKNPALAAWKVEHPEYFPPEDAGRPMLPILVERLAKMLFLTIVDADGDGKGDVHEVEAAFDAFDKNGDEEWSSDEINEALKSKLGDGASDLVATTMLSIADADGNGSVSKSELLTVIESLTV